jgi:hypothetical protein
MMRQFTIATLMLALAAIWSPAFAYSNPPPNTARQNLIHTQRSLDSYAAYGQTLPSWTIAENNHRYHGGPKSND